MPYNIHQLEFFFTHKIWFINEEKFSPVKKYAFNALRKLVLTAECYLSKHLNSHASALTYSTILATVPILAIIFAIGRGLGYGSIIEEKIKSNRASTNSLPTWCSISSIHTSSIRKAESSSVSACFYCCTPSSN